MKTAVSLPDALFEQLAIRAKERGESRSAFLAEALRRYLKELEDAELTASINEHYTEEMAEEDRAFTRAAKRAMGRILEREPW